MPHIQFVHDPCCGRVKLNCRNLWPEILVLDLLQFVPGDAVLPIGSLDLEMATPPPRGLRFKDLDLKSHFKEHDRQGETEGEKLLGLILTPTGLTLRCVRNSNDKKDLGREVSRSLRLWKTVCEG